MIIYSYVVITSWGLTARRKAYLYASIFNSPITRLRPVSLIKPGIKSNRYLIMFFLTKTNRISQSYLKRKTIVVNRARFVDHYSDEKVAHKQRFEKLLFQTPAHGQLFIFRFLPPKQSTSLRLCCHLAQCVTQSQSGGQGVGELSTA